MGSATTIVGIVAARLRYRSVPMVGRVGLVVACTIELVGCTRLELELGELVGCSLGLGPIGVESVATGVVGLGMMGIVVVEVVELVELGMDLENRIAIATIGS